MDRTGEQEALRRRLYRPDASQEDRLRYAALAGPETVPGPEVPRRRASRGPVLLVAVVAVVVVVAGLAVAHTVSRPVSPPVARPVAVATARPTVSPPPVVLTVRRGSATAMPVHGTGSATVALDVSAISLSGGSLAVLLSAADARPVGWQALRLMTRRDWSEYREPVRSSPAQDRLAVTRPAVLDYVGDPPRWIQVQAAADATWTLTVVAAR